MERDYDYQSERHFSDLGDPAAIGVSAAHKALKRLNPRKAKTQAAPVIYDPVVSMSLINHFAGAINGAGIARGTSFLKDKMGAQIFAPGVRVTDDPHRLRGHRSSRSTAKASRTGAPRSSTTACCRPGCSTRRRRCN